MCPSSCLCSSTDATEAIAQNQEVRELRREVKRLRGEVMDASAPHSGGAQESPRSKRGHGGRLSSTATAKGNTISGSTHTALLGRFLCEDAGLSDEAALLLVSSRELLTQRDLQQRDLEGAGKDAHQSTSNSANGQGTVTFYDLYDHRRAAVWGLTGATPPPPPAAAPGASQPAPAPSPVDLNEPLLDRMKKLAGLSDREVASVRDALFQRALRRSMGYRLLNMTFRCLANYAKWARERKSLEARLAIQTAKCEALETECKRKVGALQLRIFSLEDALRTPPPNDEAKLRAEIAELQEKITHRDVQLKDAAARVFASARVDLLLKNTQSALQRAEIREAKLELQLTRKDEEMQEALRSTRNELVATKASCERRVRAADQVMRSARQRTANDEVALMAAQKTFRETLKRRQTQGPNRDVSGATRMHHG